MAVDHLSSELLLIAALVIGSSCSGGEASSATETAAVTAMETESVSASVSSTSDGTESATSTSASASSAATTEPPECVTDEDCDTDNWFHCDNGSCEYSCPSPGFARAFPCSCGDHDFDYKVEHPEVVVVIDKSASMVSRFVDSDKDPNTPEVTRWFMTYNAVEYLAAEFDRTLDLGMMLFPVIGATDSGDVEACLMNDMFAVSPAPNNGPAVLATIPPAEAMSPKIAGATPARAAIELTVGELQGIVQEGDRQAIILISDGAANCAADALDPHDLFEVYDDAIVDAVSDGAAAAIQTFVIGVGVNVDDGPSPVEEDGEPDEINLHEALIAAGIAGGTANGDPQLPYYPVDDDLSFAGAMSDIVARLVPCTLEIDNPYIVPEYTEIRVGGVDYRSPVTECATEDGWRYVDEDYLVIELCGQACTDLRLEGEAQVHMWTC